MKGKRKKKAHTIESVGGVKIGEIVLSPNGLKTTAPFDVVAIDARPEPGDITARPARAKKEAKK